MDYDTWVDQTHMGDPIEIQYHARTGRFRWRIRSIPMPGKTRFENMVEGMYDDRPWSQRDVPANIRPHWMKTENLNG